MEDNVFAGRTAAPRLMAWMVHHAAQVHSVCSIGTDGLTPFPRLTRRRFGTPLAGFGERVWPREAPLERSNILNPRCVEAKLLRFCLRSSRYIVVDFEDRFRLVRTVKRADFRGQVQDRVTK